MRCTLFNSVASISDSGLDDDGSPPVLFKGTVKQKDFYQVGLPFMGPEPGMVSGNRCLSTACQGKFCWHKTAKERFLNEKQFGLEGELYFVKYVFWA